MSKETKPGDSDADLKDPPEGADEAKSLTDLLSEYDDDDAARDESVDKKPEEEQQEKRMARLEARENERDMDALVQRVKGDLDVDNWIVRAYILNEAANSPKMDALWDNRESRKADLDKIVEQALIPGFKKYAEDKILPPKADETKEDPKKESGQRRLAAAVKGARESSKSSGGSLDDVDWASLSDGEFNAKKQEVFKAAAAGNLK